MFNIDLCFFFSFLKCVSTTNQFVRTFKEVVAGNGDAQSGMTHFCVNNFKL